MTLEPATDQQEKVFARSVSYAYTLHDESKEETRANSRDVQLGVESVDERDIGEH